MMPCPGVAVAAGAYGLVGMGAVFASSARAPITAVLIIFELTGDYRIILPLMVAIIVATALANSITSDTIYTLKLRRRGIDIERPPETLMAQISVSDAMGKLPGPLTPEQPLRDVLERFTKSAPTPCRCSTPTARCSASSQPDIEQDTRSP